MDTEKIEERTEQTAAPARKSYQRKGMARRKVCQFCVEKATAIDYKDVVKIRKYTTENGKIIPRRASGVCAKHQRMLTEAIKRARIMALLPFVAD